MLLTGQPRIQPAGSPAFRFRADSGVTGSGTASAWADTLTGSGFSVSQGTGGNQPAIIANSVGGRPGLTFASGKFMSSGTSFLGTGAKEVIVVCKPSNEFMGALLSLRTTAALSILGLIDVSGTVYNYSNGSANANLVNAPLLPGVPCVIGFRTDGNTSNRWIVSINGVDVATAGQAYTTETGTNGTYIGGHPLASTLNFVGDILEVIGYSSELTTAQRQQTSVTYPNQWYGLPGLPQPIMGLNPTVLFAGDSIFEGYQFGVGVNPAFSAIAPLMTSLTAKYVAAGLTPPSYLNTAVAGQQTSDMLTNITAQLLTPTYTDLFIEIGINDILVGHVTSGTTKTNLQSILSQVASAKPGINVWGWSSVFMGGENWPNGANGSNDIGIDYLNEILAGVINANFPAGKWKMLDIKGPCMAYEAANNPGHVTSGILTQADGIHPSSPLGQTTMSNIALPLIRTVAG